MGGALIIEKAGKMNEKTVARLNKAMEKDTGELLIVLEEQRKPLDRLPLFQPRVQTQIYLTSRGADLYQR